MEEARISDGARVMGAGVPVTIGGEEHRLFFGAMGLEMIEEEFDGLLHFTTALNGGYRSKRIKAVRVGLLAGLAHSGLTRLRITAMHEALVATMASGFDEIDAVHRAICEAFDQATPPAPKDKQTSKGSARENASRGPATIGARSSTYASPQVSSAT